MKGKEGAALKKILCCMVLGLLNLFGYASDASGAYFADISEQFESVIPKNGNYMGLVEEADVAIHGNTIDIYIPVPGSDHHFIEIEIDMGSRVWEKSWIDTWVWKNGETTKGEAWEDSWYNFYEKLDPSERAIIKNFIRNYPQNEQDYMDFVEQLKKKAIIHEEIREAERSGGGGLWSNIVRWWNNQVEEYIKIQPIQGTGPFQGIPAAPIPLLPAL